MRNISTAVSEYNSKKQAQMQKIRNILRNKYSSNLPEFRELHNNKFNPLFNITEHYVNTPDGPEIRTNSKKLRQDQDLRRTYPELYQEYLTAKQNFNTAEEKLKTNKTKASQQLSNINNERRNIAGRIILYGESNA